MRPNGNYESLGLICLGFFSHVFSKIPNHAACIAYHFLFFLILNFIFFPFIFISWRLIALQYCSGFCHTLTWISHGFTCVPHPDPLPASPSTQALWVFPVHQPWALVYASNLGWWSVSFLIVYLFRWCFLWTSHPRLLPQSLKVCSVHLCLFFCFAYRVIVTIFLNFIYMH